MEGQTETPVMPTRAHADDSASLRHVQRMPRVTFRQIHDRVGSATASREGRWECPGSWLARPFRAVGLLEEVPHALHVGGGARFGPQCACDAVFPSHEGGEEQRVLQVFEAQSAAQPEAAAGAKERDVRDAAPDLPAEHKPVRLC